MRRWIFGRVGEVGSYTTTLLSSMVQAVRKRAHRVGIHKQRAHAGQKGNEQADGGAKDVTAGRVEEQQLRAPTLHGTVGTGRWEPQLCVGGVPITRAKRQLRDRISNWLASH